MADVLDAAERGERVVVDRRGVRFAIQAERPSPRRRVRRPSLIQALDPAVASGTWTWTWSPDGMTFKGRTRKR